MHLFMMSRATAKAVGFPYFCVGKACPFGNVWQRRVHNCDCLCDQCRDIRRIKAAEIREKNIERYREYGRKYEAGNREHRRSTRRAQRAALGTEAAAKQRAYYWANPDKYRAYPLKYKALDPQRVKAYARTHAERYPEKLLERARKRTNAKLLRTPGWYGEFDSFVMEEAYTLVKDRKTATAQDWHVDHMLPMRAKDVSGLHCGLNIQVIPAYLNRLKRNLRVFDEPDDWLCALI